MDSTPKKIDWNKKRIAFVKQALRRYSLRWPARQEAIKAARIDRGKYKCALCERIVGPNDFNVDHIIPVDDVNTGFTTWDSYIDRLLCEPSNLQLLCTTCHDAKTLQETFLRASNRKSKKNKK